PPVAARAARRRAPRRHRQAPRVAGAEHHDELPGRVAFSEGRHVAARRDTVRAEDGAARVFPFGVAFRRARGPPPRRRRAMANDDHAPSARVRWARLRFQILGPLLAAPADDGELKARITALAARSWRHPTTGESIRFSFKTLERWWYIARAADDPLAVLARKEPSHAGTHPSLRPALFQAIARPHRGPPRWSFQPHHDNLVALAREDPRLGPVPGYATVCRYMKGQGLLRARKRRHRGSPDGEPFRSAEREVTVPLVYGAGEVAQVDFFEVWVELAGVRQKAGLFLMRLMHSGRDFAMLC